ncbi:hypothetical protein ACFY2R_23480 [Micromonospora olivasterospora]|uniref:Uncharacterized protein n=1 Tax=Micromonospora olivasterospora TaxID=1880 RepID=A0A562IIX6_MICOL|nr:hypothetical protein [Micromonospora olivasterospora]TWH70584.1 hypothetical protein JD77_05609 [Micromonospora olivasterospora]
MPPSKPSKRPVRRRPKAAPATPAPGPDESAPTAKGGRPTGGAGPRRRGTEAPGGAHDAAAQEGNQRPFSRRGLLWAAGGGVATAIISALVSELDDRLTSPGQAVRDDRAVEAAKREDSRRKGPLSLNAYYYDRSDDATIWVAARPLTADVRRRLGTAAFWLDDGFEGGIRAVLGASDEHPYRLLTRVRLSVVGQWSAPVFVTQIRARVLRRSAPLSHAYVFQQSQGGGEPLKIGFDLDEPDSIARVIGPDGRLGGAYVDDRSLTLTPGEPLTIDVQAQTGRSYCEWAIEFDLDLDGEQRVVTVDDDGRPFRSTSLANHYQDRYHASITGGLAFDGAGPFVARI